MNITVYSVITILGFLGIPSIIAVVYGLNSLYWLSCQDKNFIFL